jgi:hypothetical protein
VNDLTWEYPILMVVALAAGVFVFSWLTRFEKKPLEKDSERVCARCKLKTVGKSTKDYLYCPFCAAKYPPL